MPLPSFEEFYEWRRAASIGAGLASGLAGGTLGALAGGKYGSKLGTHVGQQVIGDTLLNAARRVKDVKGKRPFYKKALHFITQGDFDHKVNNATAHYDRVQKAAQGGGMVGGTSGAFGGGALGAFGGYKLGRIAADRLLRPKEHPPLEQNADTKRKAIESLLKEKFHDYRESQVGGK